MQKERTEIIQDMKGICMSLLKKYRVSNANKPSGHIIFYRDGVSEGQYEQVGSKEIKVIRDACAAIDPSASLSSSLFLPGSFSSDRLTFDSVRAEYKPKLTYIICAWVSLPLSMSLLTLPLASCWYLTGGKRSPRDPSRCPSPSLFPPLRAR